MKAAKFFDQQRKDSQKLCDQLAEHMATEPEMWEKYNAIDGECIKLAGRLNDERLAGSPRQIATEADLILLRRQRDGKKHLFQIERDRLHREILKYTEGPIQGFAEYCMKAMQNLTRLYSIEILEPSHDINGLRLRRGVKGQHNAPALGRCKAKLKEFRKTIDGMKYQSLGEIEDFIQSAKKEIESFPIDTMEIIEISEDKARELEAIQREANEPVDFDHGVKYPGEKTHLHPRKETGAKLDSLAGRLSALEAK